MGHVRCIGGRAGALLAAAATGAAVLLGLVSGTVEGPAPERPVSRHSRGPGPVQVRELGALAAPIAPTEEATDRRGLPEGARPSAPPAPKGRTLARGLTWVDGRTIGTDGAPVAGLTVRARASAGAPATTGADGAFRLRAGSSRAPLRVETPGYLIVGESLRETTRELVVAPSRSLRVEVSSSGLGAPLAAADVTAGSSRRSTGADGAATVAVPVQGSISIQVSRTGYASGTVVAPPDASFVRIVLEPLAPEARLMGQVMDPSGQPVSGAHVVAGRHSARTDSRGRFELPRAGATSVEAFHPRFGAAAVVAADRIDLVLASAAHGGITVEVGEPSARVVPLGTDGAPQLLAPFWRTARADSHGRATLPPYPGAFVAVSKSGAVLARFANPAHPLTRSL